MSDFDTDDAVVVDAVVAAAVDQSDHEIFHVEKARRNGHDLY